MYKHLETVLKYSIGVNLLQPTIKYLITSQLHLHNLYKPVEQEQKSKSHWIMIKK